MVTWEVDTGGAEEWGAALQAVALLQALIMAQTQAVVMVDIKALELVGGVAEARRISLRESSSLAGWTQTPPRTLSSTTVRSGESTHFRCGKSVVSQVVILRGRLLYRVASRFGEQNAVVYRFGIAALRIQKLPQLFKGLT